MVKRLPVLLAMLINPLTMVGIWLWKPLAFPNVFRDYFLDIFILLPFWICLLLLSIGVNRVKWLPFRKYRVIIQVIAVTGILLSTNILWVGHLNMLRYAGLIALFLLVARWLLLATPEGKRSGFRTFIFGLITSVIVAEGIFMQVARTHRYNDSLASRAWHALYYKNNSAGFRDEIPPAAKMKSGRFALLTGDSFLAGQGVRKEADRISNLLETQAGVPMVNLAIPGGDVRAASETLQNMEKGAAFGLHFWFPNDIEHDCADAGIPQPYLRPYASLLPGLRYIVRHSYLLDFLYWSVSTPQEGADYQSFLESCYASPNSLNNHRQALREWKMKMLDKTERVGVVVIPYMNEVHASDFAVNKILEILQEEGIPALDLRGPLETLAPGERVVNRNDAHASALAHRSIADAVFSWISSLGWLE